jgi:chemotaxis family two-component system response regulator Rcp1
MQDENDRILDKHIGNKIKDRRKTLDLTQAELAKILGLSHQQVQRYESGENAPSMARLLEIANVLNVSPQYFYENAPLPRKPGTNQANETITKHLARPLRLLLVEDNPTDELLFRKAASKSAVACDIHTIHHAKEVMDFLANHYTKFGMERPDLIVLDINMPQMNGLTLLKHIKENEELQPIPVIMLTNSIRAKDMLEAYKLNANGFIQKNSDLIGYYDDINRILQYWGQTVVVPGTQTHAA